MGEDAAGITADAERLRACHKKYLARMSQADVVRMIADLVARWRDPGYEPRRVAEALDVPFPFAMTQVSLNALLESLTSDALWELIDREQARDARACSLIGHVIAGNTPLLAWVSILRALLLRSASLVKLPSGPAAEWGRVFAQSLSKVSPELASCIHLAQWSGGTRAMDAALCRNVDLVVAHGSAETIESLRRLCPTSVPLVGYGHRVSLGLVLTGADISAAAIGFAADILLYDQGGCLSPQTLFVEGDLSAAVSFAAQLASALPEACARFPLPNRVPQAAMTVREARLLARMESNTTLWEDPGLRWTVIARPEQTFTVSPTFGVISVQPLARLKDLPRALAPVQSCLQGCAVAAPNGILPYLIHFLASLGFSRICAPGQLQTPPFSWPQDGKPVLRTLLCVP